MNFPRRAMAMVRPRLALHVTQEVRAFGEGGAVRVALVRVEGKTPAWAWGYELGRAVAARTSREAAVVFDLRSLDAPRSPRGCGSFMTGVWSGRTDARCHFVLNGRWLEENRTDRIPQRCVYADVESAVAAAETDELRRHENRRKQAKLDLTRVVVRGGLGDLRFGMSPGEVRSLIGEPDDAAGKSWQGDESWGYDEPDLSLEFKPVRGRGTCLVGLWTDIHPVRLLGEPVVRAELARLRALLERAGVRHTETEIADGIDYQYFSHGLTLHTFGDVVDRIEWTIDVDDEAIDWSGADRVG